MFKKVISAGFVAFFGLGFVSNVCSTSNERGNVDKWLGFSPTKTSDEYSDSDNGPDYVVDRKERREERQREKEDLERWRKERVRERK